MTCSTAMLPLPMEGVSLKSCTYKASPLIIDYCIIPSTFHSYREFVSVLEPYVQLEAEFVRNFMQKPRSCYEACFQEEGEDKLKAVHPEGNLLAILQEVRKTVSHRMMLVTACAINPLLCMYVHAIPHMEVQPTLQLGPPSLPSHIPLGWFKLTKKFSSSSWIACSQPIVSLLYY